MIVKTRSIITRISVCVGPRARRGRRRRRIMHPHIPEQLHHFSEAASQCYNCIIEINWLISQTLSISSWISVSAGQRARSRRRRRRSMHPHVPEYLHYFSEGSSPCSRCIIGINEMISKTRSIITQISVSIRPSARSRHRRRRSMHSRIPEYIHHFAEASGQCYDWIIEINAMISKT
jgi:hypothetical protein